MKKIFYCYTFHLYINCFNCLSVSDIVREILENRAEIYAALNKEPIPEQEEEEEGPTVDDLVLQDHLKLQNEIANKDKEEDLDFSNLF